MRTLLATYGLTYSWRNFRTAVEKSVDVADRSGEFRTGHAEHGTRFYSDRVLDEVSFELSRGEMTALFGPNGCGKSTLMKLVAGILPRSPKICSGQVRYLGQEFWSLPAHERAKTVAYVSADLRADFPLTAREAVLLGHTCSHLGIKSEESDDLRSKVQWAMEQCLCWGLRDRLLHTLSGGERQLVALARALTQSAKILFLDEALSKMDLNHQAAMGAMLKKRTKEGWSILIVSHDMNLALEWADSAILLHKGKKIAEGPISKVIHTEALNKLYPGASLEVGKNPKTGAPQVFFGGQALLLNR